MPENTGNDHSMRTRALFLIFVFLVAFFGVWLGFQLFGRGDTSSAAEQRIPDFVTVMVVVTATPDPFATEIAQFVPPTIPPDDQVALPTNLLMDSTALQATQYAQQTQASRAVILQSQAQGDQPQVAEAEAALPSGCETYVIQSGDILGPIASSYGVTVSDIMRANDMVSGDEFLLQIGDELIIPLEGCFEELAGGTTEGDTQIIEGIDESALPTVTPLNSDNESEGDFGLNPSGLLIATSTPAPTLTLPPTDEGASIQIIGVVNAGDITAEAIRIKNQGVSQEITGWVLADENGNELVFPEMIIFANAEITVHSRSGQHDPPELYWGFDQAIWSSGDVVILRDTEGNIQSSFRVP